MKKPEDFGHYYVLDSNIALVDASNILTLGQNGENLIILPETMIDEIDTKKSGFGEINYQAREFARILSEAEVLGIDKHFCPDGTNATIMSLSVQDCFVDIVSFDKYDLQNVDASIINDRKIIHVAEFATEYYSYPEDTVFLSNDVMCRIRAIAAGVQSEGLAENSATLENEFIVTIDNFDSSKFESMHNKPIIDYDPEHLHENYCYFFKGSDGNGKIGYVVNGMINLISDETWAGLAIQPRNMGQKFAIAGMMDERIDICMIDALAGSGKTFLSISAGIEQVDMGRYDGIVYIRNSVESVDKGEEVGFLPGLDEKFKIYNYPLHDTLEFIAKKELKESGRSMKKEAIESYIMELTKQYNIETRWPGAMRGTTLSNKFVIIDEVQNFSKSTLRTVMTRLDEDCKVICIGSNLQIDNIYTNKFSNGLSTLLKAAQEEHEKVTLFGTELTKVVRGRITEFSEDIFSKDK